MDRLAGQEGKAGRVEQISRCTSSDSHTRLLISKPCRACRLHTFEFSASVGSLGWVADGPPMAPEGA